MLHIHLWLLTLTCHSAIPGCQSHIYSPYKVKLPHYTVVVHCKVSSLSSSFLQDQLLLIPTLIIVLDLRGYTIARYWINSMAFIPHKLFILGSCGVKLKPWVFRWIFVCWLYVIAWPYNYDDMLIGQHSIGLSDQFSRKYGLLISGLIIVMGSTMLSASFHIW